MNFDSPLYKSKKSHDIESILKMSTTAVLISLGIVLSLFVVFIPNFEFISLTIFLVSLLFGFSYGIFGAISVSIIYEVIVTPIYGSAGILVLFKLFCYLILVVVGSLGKNIFVNLSWWELGIMGSLFALFYDIVVTLGNQLLIVQKSLTIPYLLFILVSGVPLTIVHIVGNFITFSLTKNVVNLINDAFRYRGVQPLFIFKNKLHTDNTTSNRGIK